MNFVSSLLLVLVPGGRYLCWMCSLAAQSAKPGVIQVGSPADCMKGGFDFDRKDEAVDMYL